MGTMRLVVDVRGQAKPVEVPAGRLGEMLSDSSNRVWLDISDPTEADVERLRSEFGFHDLTLEEVTRPHERPRCDLHGGYSFIVVYAAEPFASLAPAPLPTPSPAWSPIARFPGVSRERRGP